MLVPMMMMMMARMTEFAFLLIFSLLGFCLTDNSQDDNQKQKEDVPVHCDEISDILNLFF